MNERPHVDILIAGTVCADLVLDEVPRPVVGGSVLAGGFGFSAGAAANSAVAAARLGRRVALVTTLCDDPVGRVLRDFLTSVPGIDLTWARTDPVAPSPVTVSLSIEGVPTFISHWERTRPVHVPNAGPNMGPTVGVTAVAMSARPRPWVRRLASEGTKIVMHSRRDDAAETNPDNLEGLRLANTLILDTPDAFAYSRRDDIFRAGEFFLERVPRVVVTRGRDGAIAFDRSSRAPVSIPGLPVNVRDSTGADDVFIGAYLAAFDSPLTLDGRVTLAVTAAALSLRGLGGAASAPTTRDLIGHLSIGPTPPHVARLLTWLLHRSDQQPDPGPRDGAPSA